MQSILQSLQEFNTTSCIVRLVVAALLGGSIGLEREKHGRAAGLRTHILVCTGATTTVIAGLYAAWNLGFSNDPLRAGAQVISGIGFLGAGTILMRDGSHVVGLTTAAGLWATAAIGLIVGTGFYSFAIAATAVVIVCMVLLGRAEASKRSRFRGRSYYVEVYGVGHVQGVANLVMPNRVQILPARSGLTDHIGILVTILYPLSHSPDGTVLERLQGAEGVEFVLPEDEP